MRNKSVWLVIAFVCALVACPVNAYADDGFIGGVQDFFGTREVEDVAYTFDDSYVPVLREVETVDYEDMSTQDAIQHVGNSFNSVPVDTMHLTLWQFAGWVLGRWGGSVQLTITTAVGLVFFWWGVRKSVRMVFAAFRKGRSNV